MKKSLFSIILFATFAVGVTAQDFIFNQFQSAPQLFNPAATGLMEAGQYRVAGFFRGQWDTPGAANSYAGAGAAFDYRTCSKRLFFWSLGVTAQHDRAGLASWQNTRGGLSAALHRRFGYNMGAAAGFSAGVLNFGFRNNGLLFDEQFDNGAGVFNPGTDNGESFSGLSATRFDLSSGLVLYSVEQPGGRRRNIWSAGLAFHHLTRPQYSLLGNDDQNLGIGMTLHAAGELRFGKHNQRALGYRAMFRKQSLNWTWGRQPANPQWNSLQWQGLAGISGRLFFDNKTDSRVSAGLAVRAAGRYGGFLIDAIIPSISVGSREWGFGLSYDANTTRLPDRLLGGLEMTFWKTFGKAGNCVVCPGG